MPESDSFSEFSQRLLQGDEQAADELVRDYEPEVRRFIRFRLTVPSLRRFIDSLDICQSAFAKFFVSLDKGELNLDNPDQLRRLLITIAQNKLFDYVRSEHAERRDCRRLRTDNKTPLENHLDSTVPPDEQTSSEEIVQLIQSRLSQEDRHLINQRFEGLSWKVLTKEHGSTPEALRKRMARAIDRVASELGFVNSDNE